MRMRIVVGDVTVTVEGLELTRRQVRDMLREAAGIAVTIRSLQAEPAQDHPIGFSAHLERALEPEAESYFTDDDE